MKKMPRLQSIVLGAVAWTLLSAPSLQALNKEKLADHLRKVLNLDTRAEIVVEDPKPGSELGGLLSVPVRVGGAPYTVYMSTDEKKYLWGFVADNTTDPDKMREKLIVLKGVHSRGSSLAPVTVVEYSDLQCPFCKNAHEMIEKEIYTAYKPEQVRWVFKHFPLSMHDWSEAAAVATECASEQNPDTFWSMAHAFFDKNGATTSPPAASSAQPAPSPVPYITKENVRARGEEFAKSFRLDVAKYDACLDKGAAYERVQADKKEGSVLGVSSTPTIFINGRMRRGIRNFDDIKVVIDEKLAAKKK